MFHTSPKSQLPEISASLTEDYYLNGGSSAAPPPVAVNAGTLANLQPPPPAVPNQPDDNAELKDPKLLLEVRERLYALNFDPGPLAGGRPDLTRAAVAQFARATSTALREEPTYGLLAKLRAISVPTPWGAIVYAEGANVWGMSWNETTRKDAVAHAAASCGSNAAALRRRDELFWRRVRRLCPFQKGLGPGRAKQHREGKVGCDGGMQPERFRLQHHRFGMRRRRRAIHR